MFKIAAAPLVFLVIFGFIAQANPIFAQANNCRSVGISYSTNPSPIPEDLSQITITFTGISNGRYQMRSRAGARDVYEQSPSLREIDAVNDQLVQTVTSLDDKLTRGIHTATLERWTGSAWQDYCGFINYKVGYDYSDCQLIFRPSNPKDSEAFAVDVFNAPKTSTGDFDFYKGETDLNPDKISHVSVDSNGRGTVANIIGPLSPQTTVFKLGLTPRGQYFCRTSVTISAGGATTPRPIPNYDPNPSGVTPGGGGSSGIPAFNCNPASGNCSTSAGKPCPGGVGIATAIGCIHTEVRAFIQDALTFTAAVSGGIAFLLMLIGVFRMITSAGNPDSLKAGQEQFKDAIIGLLFILLSVLLLQIIGVDILNVPDFTKL